MTIELSADFPLTVEALERRQAIEKCLENALYGIRHDPIAGNIAHNVGEAARLMGFSFEPLVSEREAAREIVRLLPD